MLSDRLITAVRQSNVPNYRLAREVQLHPVTLSDLLRRARGAEQGDPRIVNLGRLLNVAPDECFALAGVSWR
jgi:hypothetical protein